MEPYLQTVGTSVLGESPHWDAAKGELFYVDIQNNPTGVRRWNPSTGEHTRVNIDGFGAVSFVIPVEGIADNYILSTGNELQQMEWDGHSNTPTSLTSILSVEPNFPQNHFNDAKCDSLGRLWAGTVVGGIGVGSAHLYKIDRGEISTMQSNINISNGIAWNADNTLMFYIDTLTRRVDVFDYNHVNGTIFNRRQVYNFYSTGEIGVPDGMTIDANGHLWVGVFAGSKVIHIDPTTGQRIQSIPFPTTNVTCPVFGGPDLGTLYVTTGSSGLSEIDLHQQATAGALFQITNLGVKGLAPANSYHPPNPKIA